MLWLRAGADDDGFAVFGDERPGGGKCVFVGGSGGAHSALLARSVFDGQGNFHRTILA